MSDINKNPAHYKRYLRYKSGESPEEIAKEEGVSVETIMKSVRAVDVYRQMHGVGALEETAIHSIMKNEEAARHAVASGLKAKLVIRDPTTMKKIGTEPDHATQLEAARIHEESKKHIFERHKSPSTQIGVAVNTNIAPTIAEKGHSFEERLREIDRRRTSALPAAAKELPGAVIDAESEPDDSEARPASQ